MKNLLQSDNLRNQCSNVAKGVRKNPLPKAARAGARALHFHVVPMTFLCQGIIDGIKTENPSVFPPTGSFVAFDFRLRLL
jgi:hypothetical protein